MSDLSPLRNMPLKTLSLHVCNQIFDLRPLAGLPLQEIWLPPRVTDGMAVLQAMKSLQLIGPYNNALIPQKDFWERYRKGELKQFEK